MPSIVTSLYQKLDGALTQPVSPELRRQSDPTPAVVYEITSYAPSLDMSGTSTGHGRVSVRFDCVADNASTAWDLAETLIGVVDGTWTQNGYQWVLVGVEVAQTRATPDDGQNDAERIATVTAEFQVRETT